MSVSQEVTIAFDQMAAASAVIDDDSISFTCRMWHIFLREILLERDVFQSINAEILDTPCVLMQLQIRFLDS
jgi:hypothetical protein